MTAYQLKKGSEILHGGLGASRDLEGITTVYRQFFLRYDGEYHATIPTRMWKGKLPRNIDKAYWRR